MRVDRRNEAARGVEQLLGPVTSHPALQHRQVGRVLPHVCQGDLMRPKRPLDRLAIHRLRAGPALRRAQYDGGPRAAHPGRVPAGVVLDLANPRPANVECRGEVAGDARRSGAGDDVDVVTVAEEEAPYRLVRLTTEDGRAGDLVSVQVEDGQHRTIPRRVEEVDALPRALEWPRFGLAISDHGDREEVRVVEDGPEGVHEDVAELAALVDGAGRRHAHVARHAARRRELAEEPLQAVGVPCDRGVDLAVGALEVRVREESRAPVAWTGQVDDGRVDLSDHAAQMDVDQARARQRYPMPEERRCGGVVQKVTPTCMASTRASIGLREQRPTKKCRKNQWSRRESNPYFVITFDHTHARV